MHAKTLLLTVVALTLFSACNAILGISDPTTGDADVDAATTDGPARPDTVTDGIPGKPDAVSSDGMLPAKDGAGTDGGGVTGDGAVGDGSIVRDGAFADGSAGLDGAGAIDAATDGTVCVPITCAGAGKDCGTVNDGCGGSIDCGACQYPDLCGGSGKANVCGCAPTDDCTTYGWECGTFIDSCQDTVDCGDCDQPETCGGSGKPGHCGCTPTTCAAAQKNCGYIDDGCGDKLYCGECVAPWECGAGGAGESNVCGCVPTQTCATNGFECGQFTDNCNVVRNCGECELPRICGIDGKHQCVCAPYSCDEAGAGCGMIVNPCDGSTIDCGECRLPETCGGGGKDNVCGCAPTTCQALGRNCGEISDGCFGKLLCGICTLPEWCGGSGVANLCGCTSKTSCESEGLSCGDYTDECMVTTECGECRLPETCGGGGRDGVCGCTPTTCEAAGKNCDLIDDGCGGSLDCGRCLFRGQFCGVFEPNVCAFPPPSCVGLADTCGPKGTEDCCQSLEVEGGTFNRGNDTRYPATVSSFHLDKYEITVGRFKKFVTAGLGTQAAPPAVGSGAHPLIDLSGWQAGFNGSLPSDTTALLDKVTCDAPFQTWTDVAGANENLPMNCLSWYLAFAFCAWDGGRLPTEAEWNYAAAGGSEQRTYAWTGTTVDWTYASYNCLADGSAGGVCAFTDILVAGARSPRGDGRWGQSDLSGNVKEWTLDWYYSPYQINPCNDCAYLTTASSRSLRGGSYFSGYSYIQTTYRDYDTPTDITTYYGARCARDLD
ncbi:MAG: SUMF1/EgtB/PvdO family nonheme iron enzyme [Pseudomonadota bacterium]